MVVNEHLPVAIYMIIILHSASQKNTVQTQSCNVTAATDPRANSARTSHVPTAFASSSGKPCRYGKTSWPLRLDRRSSFRSLETSCRISCESHVSEVIDEIRVGENFSPVRAKGSSIASVAYFKDLGNVEMPQHQHRKKKGMRF
uniref:Uncharacterized protein n=1 Tax=Brassica oleracea var. oleracea TaxID=109376 RepID=A0A0D3B1D2_BRAOL